MTDLHDDAGRDDLTVAEALAIEEATGRAIVEIRRGMACPNCHGVPPRGFACLSCGARRQQ